MYECVHVLIYVTALPSTLHDTTLDTTTVHSTTAPYHHAALYRRANGSGKRRVPELAARATPADRLHPEPGCVRVCVRACVRVCVCVCVCARARA